MSLAGIEAHNFKLHGKSLMFLLTCNCQMLFTWFQNIMC